MFTNQINISHLVPEVETQHTHDACLMIHLALERKLTTSELRTINWCRMSKGVFFISDKCNHQGNHLQKSTTDKNTNLNLIYDLNWPRKTTQQQQNGRCGKRK